MGAERRINIYALRRDCFQERHNAYWELEAWVSTYVAIATGEMSVVSHTVQALTGHAPQTLTDYVRRHPESYQHITATRL